MKKENFNLDLDKVLKSKPKAVVQKVVPEKEAKESPDEKQVSFYIDKNLLIRLKIKALEDSLNFKEVMAVAVKKYLE